MKSKHALKIFELNPPAFVEEQPRQLLLKIIVHNIIQFSKCP